MRPEELMRKIQEMEADHARLKREMAMWIIEEQEEGEEDASRYGIVEDKDWLMPPPLPRERWKNEGGGSRTSGCKRQEVPTFTNEQYMNILESMGQSVHIMDCNYRIIYCLQPEWSWTGDGGARRPESAPESSCSISLMKLKFESQE